MKRIALFASGNGTNAENILKKIKQKKLRVDAALVFTDKPKAKVIKRVKPFGIETMVLEPKEFFSKDDYEQCLVRELKKRKIDYIILAGYMRLVGTPLLKAFNKRILNIHPALLPSFKGKHGIKDAYDYGVHVTGVTVHIVDDTLDGGPIILQRAIEVKKNETLPQLEKRIHAIEYELYPKAIDLLAKGILVVKGRKVQVL